MVQIVKRKKKGRPSKSDLARRSTAEGAQPERDLRRSHRRRSVRYNIDYDDFVDDDDEDEEDERRREKKLKLVLKLPHSESAGESAPSGTRRDENESGVSASSSEYGNKPLKKRRIDGEDDDDDGDGDHDDDDDDEERGRKADSKGMDSVLGTPAEVSSGIPLPDKKSLELILDKLQKKDIYGVYAEPVDPEELPDYHDVIEHPMDFATVRKKLGNGSYRTFEEFESDVFLICTNAMQYNAPDTIYHKQARAIQELARKKFQKLRIDIGRSEKELKSERSEKELKSERSEKELKPERFEKELKSERSEKELKPERSEKDLKSEQKMRSNPLVKKQIKKPIFRTAQEPVGSDFSSGATLATMGDVQNGFNATQAGGCERPSNVDGLIIESNPSQIDNNLEKAEELFSGKGLLSKFGRKPFVVDENRRATYSISNQPIVGSETIFNTFEAEAKQLVAVGLHADHSYARSLARFAATLGPVAWKVASQRIEQALPVGSKFGRGWVGEFEPLPTPVLMLETRIQKEPFLVPKLQHNAVLRKDEKISKPPVPAKEHSVSGPTLEGKQSLFCPASAPTTERKQPLFGSAGTKSTPPVNTGNQQQNPLSRNFTQPEKKVLKQVELNCPPSASQNHADLVSEKQLLNGSEAATPRSMEAVSRSRNILQSLPFKLPDTNGVVAGGLTNGKPSSRIDGNKMIGSASDTVPSQLARVPTYLPHGAEQGLSDPVQLMRKLAEKAQKQQKSSNHSPVDSPPAMPSIPSPRSDSSNAAATAARAWMSIGAGGFKPVAENSITPKNHISADSLYNPTRELHPQVTRFRGEFPVSGGMHFQSEKNSFPLQAFVPQPVRIGEAQFQNRPVIFPQLVTADLSRFQMQSPWQGLNPNTQPRHRQETLPPDLNIGFQPSGSPVRQSSGVLVDSQQPDLALQL
ncbi:hypothetical protein VitviT2T_029864 [Vitis vinifera]|uniref:Bromo domain-containing protein n=2 Tax=Vitis vinifera TaxID=29760 RepID=A0ABY9DXL1_VITVI|nr:uncharacterized protein LOC100267501 [Vitis vinifera]WKA12488.1 hypothetical protein VitviT2T_029864 [Vitis vinifera]|eukprot:XP_010644458.1 PREDICTED: uncharacterized protein LOC100267501 [Vitis vinifera]